MHSTARVSTPEEAFRVSPIHLTMLRTDLWLHRDCIVR